ncbi:hypothetical protein DFR74_1188 [Nocardia puris]|uniref:Uncharacterized protein n=1 Tax=Nocardia puris TaxID=208602 RepID=A0A366D2C5_9NOCA|nr:hypothetical protein DFR74_1188 [Nocardia puris]
MRANLRGLGFRPAATTSFAIDVNRRAAAGEERQRIERVLDLEQALGAQSENGQRRPEPEFSEGHRTDSGPLQKVVDFDCRQVDQHPGVRRNRQDEGQAGFQSSRRSAPKTASISARAAVALAAPPNRAKRSSRSAVDTSRTCRTGRSSPTGRPWRVMMKSCHGELCERGRAPRGEVPVGLRAAGMRIAFATGGFACARCAKDPDQWDTPYLIRAHCCFCETRHTSSGPPAYLQWRSPR